MALPDDSEGAELAAAPSAGSENGRKMRIWEDEKDEGTRSGTPRGEDREKLCDSVSGGRHDKSSETSAGGGSPVAAREVRAVMQGIAAAAAPTTAALELPAAERGAPATPTATSATASPAVGSTGAKTHCPIVNTRPRDPLPAEDTKLSLTPPAFIPLTRDIGIERSAGGPPKHADEGGSARACAPSPPPLTATRTAAIARPPPRPQSVTGERGEEAVAETGGRAVDDKEPIGSVALNGGPAAAGSEALVSAAPRALTAPRITAFVAGESATPHGKLPASWGKG